MTTATDHMMTAMIRREPSRGWASLRLDELWAYRGLFYFFVWRDIKVRYKQTILGASWAILQPFLTMLIFSLFFGRLAKVPSDGIPYPLFAFAALVPWNLFANGVTLASNTLVAGSNMVKKIYFPRLVMPSASVFASLVDFVLAFAVLLGMLLFYGYTPTLNVIWLPVLLLLLMTTALGVSFWLSALNVQFRDVRYVVPFLVQLWLFASPVAYPSSMLSEPWRTVYALNPMVGVVEGFRWALLGTDTAPGLTILASSMMALALFLSGCFVFRRLERTFADVI